MTSITKNFIKKYLTNDEIEEHLVIIGKHESDNVTLFVCVAKDNELILQSQPVLIGHRDKFMFYDLGFDLATSWQLLFGTYIVKKCDNVKNIAYMTIDGRIGSYILDGDIKKDSDVGLLGHLENVVHGFMNGYKKK